MKLKKRLLLMALIPVLAMGILILIIVGITINQTFTNDKRTALKAVAQGVLEVYEMQSREPFRNEGNKIYKGDFCVSDSSDLLERIKSDTGLELSLFYGDVRVATTVKDEEGRPKVNTRAPEEAIKVVLEQGEPYFNESITALGIKYYGSYMPLLDSRNGKDAVVGMVFAGYPRTLSMKQLNKLYFVLALTILILSILITVNAVLSANGICRNLDISRYALAKIAGGRLDTEVSENTLKRADEIGDIARNVNRVKEELRKIVKSISDICTVLMDSSQTLDDTAEQTASSTEQVERAVNEIAQGASSQASETHKASGDVMIMGQMIQETACEVENLSHMAADMSNLSRDAAEILEKLKEVTETAKEAIAVIHNQTNATNQSAQKIREATEIITSIADETNLLSLNASIEAARAGEQGKGFAVVAAQIQKLAEQSNESAMVIAKITNDLIDDSNKAVDTMNEVWEIMETQVSQVDATENIFQIVRDGIAQSISGVGNIAEKTDKLDGARISVVDSVQNLTAIAQQNAAGTQETLASTEEVATSIGEVADLSSKLMKLSEQLEAEIKIFQL